MTEELATWAPSKISVFKRAAMRTERFTRETKLRLLRWLLRDLSRDSNYVSHGRREMADWFAEKEEGPNKWIAEGTEELLMLLSTHGHSGGSIGFALNIFKTLASFQPRGPLTGEDSEWNEVGEGRFQNRRCSHVFKDHPNGPAYDNEGRIFKEPNGACYTNSESRVEITFPYTPKREYVDVPYDADE